MTQIDFYILQDTEHQARWHFACRLIEKAYRLDRRILVAVDSQEHAELLDDLLWSFKPESFLPHRLLEATDAPEAPIEITFGENFDENFGEHRDVLINLSSKVPEHFSRFERLSEVVIQEPEILQATREHFSFYKTRGYPIQHRKL